MSLLSMGTISKTLAIFLTSAIVMSCLTFLMIETANAQSIPVPATPTFTVKLVDNSCTTPITTTTSTDPYTNKTTITKAGGQYVKNYTIELIIENQALPSTVDSSKYSIYYSIRLKPHFEEYWTLGQYGELAPCNNSLSPDPSEASITECFQNLIPKQSDGPYTIFPIDGSFLNQSDQIDFQVKAVIGHTFNLWTENYVIDHYYAGIPRYGDTTVLVPTPSITEDSEGNWSTIQTLTIPVISPTLTSDANNTLPFSFVIIAIAVVLVIVIILALVLLRKHRKKRIT